MLLLLIYETITVNKMFGQNRPNGRKTGQQIAELIWPLDVVYLMIKISDSLFSFKIPEIDLRLGHLEDS